MEHDDFLFYQQIAEHNILPLTGRCNFRCRFCSHGNNPASIAKPGPHRSWEQLAAAIGFLDAGRPVIIGESASVLSEGEPFLHPHWQRLLAAIRERLPATTIQITTNGSFLTEETVFSLARLAPIRINLSLNTIGCRRVLLGDKQPETAIAAPKLLHKWGIPFQGSIVLMPWVCGWDDIKATVAALAAAETIRLLLPGFSAGADFTFDWEALQKEAMQWLKAQNFPLPVLLEPPRYRHNRPEIEGIVPHSPASAAGLQKGDEILTVNGRRPANRHEAWRLLCDCTLADIQLRRQGQTFSVHMKKGGDGGGIVFENDLDLRRLGEVAVIAARRGGPSVLCHSVFGTPYLEANRALIPELEGIDFIVTENHYFGGNIQAAGLLTIADYRSALRNKRPGSIKALFLPREGFTNGVFDLAGESLCDFEQEIQGKIYVI